MLDTFDKLTLVLYSNRVAYTKAALSHALSIGCRILVPSSSNEFYESLKQSYPSNALLSIIPPPCISDGLEKQYNQSNLNARLSLALAHIKTPYFILFSDDDYLIPSSLSAAIDYLDSHTQCANYFGSTYQVIFSDAYVPFISCMYRPADSTLKLPDIERVISSASYYPLIYGVSRTSVLRDYIELAPPASPWAGSYEFIFSTAVALSGSSYFSRSNPFLIRLGHPPTRSITEDYPPSLNPDTLVVDFLSPLLNVSALRSLLGSNTHTYRRLLTHLLTVISREHTRSYLVRNHESTPYRYTPISFLYSVIILLFKSLSRSLTLFFRLPLIIYHVFNYARIRRSHSVPIRYNELLH